MNKKELDVIVIGELNVDLILNKIESFPEVGKEKIAEKMDLVLGSSSAIFASNLSSLGAKVGFLGKIGNDIFGNLVIKSFKKKNVNTELIVVDESLKTGATIVLNFDEDRAMVTHPGAMEYLSFDDINFEEISKAQHLHVSSIFLQPKLKENLVEIFERVKKMGLTTSLDTQWDPNEKWDLDLKNLLPYVDIFLPNEKEIKYLTDKVSIDEALDSISSFSNVVAVKLGNKGSLLWQNKTSKNLDAFLNNNVVDAIGAGDSFDAGFIFKFIKGEALEKCQQFGNLIGAINTTSSGGTSAFVDYEQIIKIAKNKFGFIDK